MPLVTHALDQPEPGGQGISHFRAGGEPRVSTRADGLVTVAELAAKCDVSEACVRNWISRGYKLRDGSATVKLRVEGKQGRENLVSEIEGAKAEFHTRERARRPAA